MAQAGISNVLAEKTICRHPKGIEAGNRDRGLLMLPDPDTSTPGGIVFLIGGFGDKKWKSRYQIRASHEGSGGYRPPFSFSFVYSR